LAKRTILVIEDDPAIRRGIVDTLEFAGYSVLQESTGIGGSESALKCDCDLVLLDLVLPGMDGLDILRRVKPLRASLPVIILSARGDEDDRVAGLRLGADDYVVKPFSARELLARVEAVLRRSPERPVEVGRIAIDGGEVDFSRREIRFADGQRQSMTDREEQVFRHLVRNAGRAIGREELLAHVWRINPRAIVETRTVDMAVRRLREKLRDDAAEPRIILTVRGKGYMFGGNTGGNGL
jgi:two-component system alkaline phosphatase synthesis response regulator PhoP